MPVSLLLTTYVAINNKFEAERSFQTGEFIFSTNNIINARARTYANAILIEDRAFNSYNVYSHEFIHIYQYYDYNFVNTYLNKPYRSWSNKSRTFSKLNNIFHWDIQGAVLRPLYLLENNNRSCYYDNFFEYEAGLFSNTINCRQ